MGIETIKCVYGVTWGNLSNHAGGTDIMMIMMTDMTADFMHLLVG